MYRIIHIITVLLYNYFFSILIFVVIVLISANISNSFCIFSRYVILCAFVRTFNPHPYQRGADCARGELQLLVHCYMRNRAACARQVFCKITVCEKARKFLRP